MKNILFLLLTIIITLNAQNSDTFIQKQTDIELMKKVIQEEEMIASAYEKYVIKQRKLPLSLSVLQIPSYLGISFSVTSLSSTLPFSINSTAARMTSRIYGTTIENDTNLKALYEASLYRKNTYYISSGLIGIKLNNSLARHLYYLMRKANTSSILDCSSLDTEFCTKNNHIYIYTDTERNTLLMYYQINKFNTGPIIITNDPSLYSNDAFNSISKGTLLYDTDGVKYIKTDNAIEALK